MSEWSDFVETFTLGNTHRLRFVVTQGGVDQPIETWRKFWFTAKRRTTDADSAAVIALTDGIGGGITRLDASNDPGNLGKCEVEIPSSATVSLPNIRTTLYADIQGEDPSGAIWTLQRGTLILVARATLAVT